MQLNGKNILVVGAGKTGIATTRFLLQQGAVVTLADASTSAVVPAEFIAKNVRVKKGAHDIGTFCSQDAIVVSPGVPLTIPALAAAREKGCEIISEIELAFRFMKTPLIAVTGTNGKTTTTSLLGEIFTAAGCEVFVGGNIGTPIIEYAAGLQNCRYVVAEISSFQLEGITTFRPAVSVLLNITDDHLDRYDTFDDYAQAKKRIFSNQQENDTAVLNFDDSGVRALAGTIAAQTFMFSTRSTLDEGSYYNGTFHFRRRDSHITIPAQAMPLTGAHNRENMLAAASVGYLCGLPPDSIHRALMSFSGLPHRMELVAKHDHVAFYNDSKGTNVGACLKSLESLERPIILIAGGKDKGGSYSPLREVIQKKVKLMILLGEAKKRMHKDLGDCTRTIITSSLEEAVEAAVRASEEGDCVLFSPACSSFDMFRSYEHRGECFKELVGNMTRTGSVRIP